MPKRPSSHQVADQAVHAVQTIIGRLGWSSEKVVQDYGEDLLVQPVDSDNEVEDFRIWVQVKGTRDLGRLRVNGGYRWKVKASTAMRWIRSKDPVVAVLWDVVAGKGLFTTPRHHFSDWKIAVEGASTELTFDEDSTFDEEACRKLRWRALLEHYDGLIRDAAHSVEMADSFKGDAATARKRLNLLCLEVLKKLDALVGAKPRRKLSQWIQNATRNFVSDGEAPEKARRLASTLALYGWIDEVTGLGTPVMLGDYVGHFLWFVAHDSRKRKSPKR